MRRAGRRSVIASPPVKWDATRRRKYLEWAAHVVKGYRHANARLEARFDEAYRRGRRVLG